MKTTIIWTLALFALILSACGTTPEPVGNGAGELVAIDFAEVEVGLGSPTPVAVTIDARYPSTCAQYSQISQKFVEEGGTTRITIEVRAMDMVGVCNADELSFRMILPINASGLPKGVYVVEVNGVDAGSFEFQN